MDLHWQLLCLRGIRFGTSNWAGDPSKIATKVEITERFFLDFKSKIMGKKPNRKGLLLKPVHQHVCQLLTEVRWNNVVLRVVPEWHPVEGGKKCHDRKFFVDTLLEFTGINTLLDDILKPVYVVDAQQQEFPEAFVK